MTINLRKRKQTKNGKISLYLEIYKGKTTTADGKPKYIREYQFLNLFLIDNPKTEADKQQNKKILQLAKNIKNRPLSKPIVLFRNYNYLSIRLKINLIFISISVNNSEKFLKCLIISFQKIKMIIGFERGLMKKSWNCIVIVLVFKQIPITKIRIFLNILVIR